MRGLSGAIGAGAIAAVLIAAGLFALRSTGVIGPDRPAASGDAGVLAVYAQTAFGPVRLVPGEPRTLPRPQDFAFQFTCEGTGPRVVRIELVRFGAEAELLFEDKMTGPANMESLEYVLSLGDDAPNELTLVTTVESPHDRVRTHRFPITLGGRP